MWIEICNGENAYRIGKESLPSRGVWIEMFVIFYTIIFIIVAPLAGSVD